MREPAQRDHEMMGLMVATLHHYPHEAERFEFGQRLRIACDHRELDSVWQLVALCTPANLAQLVYVHGNHALYRFQHTAFTRQETSYPGRRIALLVDGSSSMVMKFETKSLKTPENRAFYTAVAAAEHFMKLRMNGRYHDLIALIQFGNEAYVVTPFTTDYENIMLSIRLISSPKEWGSFNDWGTTIMQGLNQATQLFRAFDFVNASGNAMVMFTDGRDDEKDLKGKPIQSVIDDMKKYKIPVYMIRTGYDLREGQIPTDKLWKPIVEQTGGRFYAADSEDAILKAEAEIDKLATGRIDVREYTAQRPRFDGYALVAIALWLSAGIMKLGFRTFRTFP